MFKLVVGARKQEKATANQARRKLLSAAPAISLIILHQDVSVGEPFVLILKILYILDV